MYIVRITLRSPKKYIEFHKRRASDLELVAAASQMIIIQKFYPKSKRSVTK